MPYHGQVCRHSLNSTLSLYRHTPRFFDNKFGLLGTEQFLLTVTKVINDFVTEDEKCRYILLNMLCQYTLQPCYPNNKVIEYCREDCEAIFDECSGSLNQVIGAVKLLVKEQGIDFVHTGLPDCSRHKPYSYFEDKPDEICIKTGFFSKYSSVFVVIIIIIELFCVNKIALCQHEAQEILPWSDEWLVRFSLEPMKWRLL